MSTENDGMDEAIEGQLRVLLTAASQAGEALARAIEQQRRHAASTATQETAQLTARLDGEREAARAALAVTHNPQWWDQARAEDVAGLYRTAEGWSKEDPEAAATAQAMRQEVQRRYGISVEQLTPAAMESAAAVERERGRGDEAEAHALSRAADAAEQRQDQVEQAREGESDPAVREELRAEALTQEDRAQAQRVAADPAYDSAERREVTARGLTDQGHSEQHVATVMRADIAQARPATQAVAGNGPRKPAQARKASTQAAEQQRASLGR